MFPAIRSAFKEWRSGFGTDLVTLDLKAQSYDLFGFDTQMVGLEQQKLDRIRAALTGYGPSWSGLNVSDMAAMNLSTVWACRRIISECVAFLPLSLMQKRNGAKREAPEHPVYSVVHDEPNSEMSDMEWRETETDHTVAGGNAFSRIIRRSGIGTAIELWPIMPAAVTMDRDQAKQLVYIVKDSNEQEKTYTVQPDKPQDILHVRGLSPDGLKGYSVITMARQSIGTALSAERYAALFYARGGRPPYHIEWDKKFKHDEDFQKWAEDWRKMYGSPDSLHLAPIMEPGMSLKPDGWSPQDSQFLESRLFGVPEICRWFLISPDMVGDLSKATLNNMEQLMLRFYKLTLMSWIIRWEKALRRCVLTPEEKAQGYYFKHNVDGLLRGDFASRMAGYASALTNGHANIDEIRDFEDKDPLPNGAGRAFHFPLNMQTVPGTGAPTASEMAAIAKFHSAPEPQQPQQAA